jgi:hypothetical protein
LEEVEAVDWSTDQEVSVSYVLRNKVEPQHFMRARSYAPVVDFVLIADKVSVDAETAD